MSQFNFGAGEVFLIPPAAATDQSPIRVATLQEIQVDLDSDIKYLYGSKQFAEVAANAQAKISGKIKFARIDGKLLTAILPGVTSAVGNVIEVEETNVLASHTYTVTGSATFKENLGVYAPDGTPYTKVTASPVGLQYTVSAGVYTFETATQDGKTLKYRYSKTQASTGNTISNANPSTGVATTFAIDAYNYANSNLGKSFGVKIYAAVFSKFSVPFKNTDYTMFDLDFQGLDNGSGQVYDLYEND